MCDNHCPQCGNCDPPEDTGPDRDLTCVECPLYNEPTSGMYCPYGDVEPDASLFRRCPKVSDLPMLEQFQTVKLRQ